MNRSRWTDLMQRLGWDEHVDIWANLRTRYAEPHRHYHTGAHLEHCLQALAQLDPLPFNDAAVELALWFHDAIYVPRRSDNEVRSAELAEAFLVRAGAGSDLREAVVSHILATRHHAPASDPDSVWVVDIDLSILGQPPEVYGVFEHQIRQEYEWVPSVEYAQKRSQILRSFLERQPLFGTQLFQDRYEEQARFNLQKAIALHLESASSLYPLEIEPQDA